MARIRTIKPEFCQSESMGRVSRDAQLLYVKIWTIVDDAGRARGSSRMLASLLYPYDDEAPKLIDSWLLELGREGCVRRYDVDGSTYIDLPKWLKHQKIDRPSQSRLPAFEERSRLVANTREVSATDLVPSTLDLGPSTETLDHGPGTGTKAAKSLATQATTDAPSSPSVRKRQARSMIAADFTLTVVERKYALDQGWSEQFIDQQLEKFKNHHLAKGSTMADWSAAWRKWVSNGYDFAPMHPMHPMAPRAGRVSSAMEGIASRMMSRADSAIEGMFSDLDEDDFKLNHRPP